MVKAVEPDIKLQLPKATTPPLPRAGAPSIDLARPTRVTAWRENAQMDAEGSVRRGRCSRRPSEDKMENFVIVWTIDGETMSIPHPTQDQALHLAETLFSHPSPARVQEQRQAQPRLGRPVRRLKSTLESCASAFGVTRSAKSFPPSHRSAPAIIAPCPTRALFSPVCSHRWQGHCCYLTRYPRSAAALGAV